MKHYRQIPLFVADAFLQVTMHKIKPK